MTIGCRRRIERHGRCLTEERNRNGGIRCGNWANRTWWSDLCHNWIMLWSSRTTGCRCCRRSCCTWTQTSVSHPTFGVWFIEKHASLVFIIVRVIRILREVISSLLVSVFSLDQIRQDLRVALAVGNKRVLCVCVLMVSLLRGTRD